MGGIVLQKEKEKSWIRYIKQRIKQNKNFLGFISGPTGSAKSWSSLRIAEDLDKDFEIEIWIGRWTVTYIRADWKDSWHESRKCKA